MKPSTSSYFAKLALMNIAATFLVGLNYDIRPTSSELASSTPETSSPADVAPVISHALDQVEQANRSQGFFGWFNNIANRNCADCIKEVADMRYGQCRQSDKNGYLERQLEETASQPGLLGALIRKPVRTNSIIKPICMQMSMEMGRSNLPSGSFKSCNGSGYGTAVGPACIGEKYFKLVNNSFDLVSSCMKSFIAENESKEMQNLDVRAVYALVNIESGFHINAVSGTGAGGIGQFTTAAIADVNANQIPAARQALESNSNPVCGRMSMELLDSLQPIRNSAKASCDRISIKNGNPVKNMIYTFAYLRGVKKDLDRQIFTNKNYKRKFNLSEYDLARVKRAMMVWSHNTGTAGTLTPTKALLNTLYRNKQVTNADTFINQLQQYMQKFPARANSGAARRKETSRYFPTITDRLHQIETNAGGGSCVN